MPTFVYTAVDKSIGLDLWQIIIIKTLPLLYTAMSFYKLKLLSSMITLTSHLSPCRSFQRTTRLRRLCRQPLLRTFCSLIWRMMREGMWASLFSSSFKGYSSSFNYGGYNSSSLWRVYIYTYHFSLEHNYIFFLFFLEF